MFAGTQAIPALGAGDESRWTLQMNFPRNFVYRLVEALVSVTAGATADFTDPEPGMRVLVSSDAGDFNQWSFPLTTIAFEDDSASLPIAIGIAFTSVTPDLMAFYRPPVPIGSFIDAAAGAARLLVTWMNRNPTSGAVTANFRFRALQYDQDQVRKYPVHTPTPIIGA